MIQNPILKGFCPDPSIIRVGEDYYIATSTFEWWPGVRLFHSKDLKHWEQIPSALRRDCHLNMLGDPTSGGVWAPCLTHDGKRFYLVYTDVKTKKGKLYNTHNYVVYTDDIYGEWSDPIYLNSIGFDPSLFHDTDGKKYLINMINGFKGITVQELDEELHLIGERKLVYKGTDMGFTEGPHMYHIGDWYYLIVAEGGTSYNHCVTMARSKSVWGPFETAPNNPILTSDREDMNALQKCGHADFCDTPEGEWYMVHLCSRPLNGEKWCTLGRETAIQKMEWDENGWLRLKGGGSFAKMETEEPAGIAEAVLEDESNGFFDDFTDGTLHLRYISPRVNHNTFADCTARKGYLRLRGQESLNSLHNVSVIAVRQQKISCSAETKLDFKPVGMEHMAGLTYMYHARDFYVLGKTVTEDGQTVLRLIKSETEEITDRSEPVPVPREGEIKLRVEVSGDGTQATFYYSIEDGEWQQIGEPQTTKILTDEHARGFTGACFGMYVRDMDSLCLTADFDYFKVED